MKKPNRDLELLYEVGSLRNLPRGWTQQFGGGMANDLEHTLRVIYLALIIARKEGIKNDELIMKMALIHDIAETRTGDTNIVQNLYVDQKEKEAAHDTLTGTSIVDLEEVLLLYKKRECIEAKIVKDADNLDIDIEMKEMEERGHQLPKKKAFTRKMVRDQKLYTETAKKLWDEIQISDVSSWHLTNNKWFKKPNAGK